jgi:hypothetical protein
VGCAGRARGRPFDRLSAQSRPAALAVRTCRACDYRTSEPVIVDT